MDKELLKMLKKLNTTLEKKIEKTGGIEENIDKAFKQPAEISIKRYENGQADCHIEGNTLAILITLAALEKGILERLNPPKGLWELIKNETGSIEVKENE